MNSRQKIVQQQFLNNEQRIIKRLDQVYVQAHKDITASISQKYKEINGLTMQINLLDKDDPQRVILESQRQSKVYQKAYQQQLGSQVSDILDNLHQNEYKTVSKYLNECYDEGFLGTLYDLHGQGVPFSLPINQQAVVHAVQLDSKISHGLYARLGEDVKLLKQKIMAQTSRMMVNGTSYAKASEHLANYTNIGYNNAIRIVRTEGHRIQCTASMDAMTDAVEKGADVVKQWDATLDGKVRPTHVMCDGEIRELDQPFSNGLMFPSDPNGSASEVVNCRCALLQRARWALDDGFTKWDHFHEEKVDGVISELRTFNSPTDYNEFKKWYFSDDNMRYMSYVQDLENKYLTRDFTQLLGLMNEREYQTFKKLEALRPAEPMKNVASKATTGNVDLTIIRSELKQIRSDIVNLKGQLETAQRMKTYGWNQTLNLDEDITRLQKKVDELSKQRIKKGKILIENLNDTYKFTTDNEDLIQYIVDLDQSTTYREVRKLDKMRDFSDIVSAVAGADRTDGSCASVGLAYIGQRNGWDVLDFRDGSSRDWFGGKLNKLSMWNNVGVKYITEDSAKTNLTNAKRIMSKLEVDKEYYLSVGRHASIVRAVNDDVIDPLTGEIIKTVRKYQYLELQADDTGYYTSGWHDFGDLGSTFKNRFGCSSSSASYSTAYATDISQLEDNDGFRTILGYINTAENEQRKGVGGGIK